MNKEKLKEQNSSRLTEPKNGLIVTNGRGTGEDGWEGRYGGKRGMMISTYNVGVEGHKEGSIAERRQVVTLYHLTTLMNSDCNGVCGGDLIMGGV